MSPETEKEASIILLAGFPINLVWRLRSLPQCVCLKSVVALNSANDHEDGILSFATIALVIKVPRMVDPKRQQVAVIVWGTVLFGMYGSLLSVFRIKNGGYPFYLPPF